MTAKRIAQDVGSGNGLNLKLLFVVYHPGLFCGRLIPPTSVGEGKVKGGVGK